MAIYLTPGQSGPNVGHLQKMLNFLADPDEGSIAVDGVFGMWTKARVMGFQKRSQLIPDGTVGPSTIKALVTAVFSRIFMYEDVKER